MALHIDMLASQLKIDTGKLRQILSDYGINYDSTTSEIGEESLKKLYSLKEIILQKDGKKETTSEYHLENIIKNNDIIFIDTSALLQESSVDFLKKFLKLLEKYNKEVVLIKRVYDELQKHQVNENDKVLSKMATDALHELVKIQDNNRLKIVGDENMDTFADNDFLVHITRLRLKAKVLLITNDIKLGQDILKMNDSKSVQGKPISVQKVNKSGYFSKVWGVNEKPSTKKIEKNYTKTETIVYDKFDLGEKVKIISEEIIPIHYLPNSDQIVKTSTGKKIKLGIELGSGGEGIVYSTDIENFVAKIYKKEKLTKGRYEKLNLMLTKSIAFKGICYPTALLFNDYDEFVGYLMPEAKGDALKHFLFIPKKVFQTRHPDWNRAHLAELCHTILNGIIYLHNHNIVLGDINPFNILVVDSKTVYFVDVDSYQIGEFPCPVGTANFTAPEIQGKNYKSFLRSFGNEYFAISTLLFEILMMGKAPYSQTGGESDTKNIMEMDFPYSFGKGERADNTPKGAWRYIWSNLPYYLKEAFFTTFQKGQPHSQVETRFDANKWSSVINKYYKQLSDGTLAKQDPMAMEIFPTRSKITNKSQQSLVVCRVCNNSYPSWQVKESICKSCLNEGVDYQCKRCGKELIFTNFERYVRKMTKGFDCCKDCNSYLNEEYANRVCVDCGNRFSIRNKDAEYFNGKGWDLPTRCYECRQKRNGSGGSNVHTHSTTTYRDHGYSNTDYSNSVFSSNPKPTTTSSSWCFLTTTVCEYFGLQDDCYQLEALRSYRDNWLLKQPDGPALVDEYYEVAPAIVDAMKRSVDYDVICETLMNDYINPCLRMIENGSFDECKKHYMKMFYLMKKFTFVEV